MGVLFKKEELITAFDIEGDLIKMAQVKIIERRRSLYRLMTVRSKSSGQDDLSKAIHDLNVRFKLPRSMVLLNLPRHMVTVREMKLPSVSREELESMIDLQSAKLLPYPKEEVVYDYKVIETTQDGYSRVMLVLTHRDVVDKLLEIFKRGGVDIHRIALSSEVLSNWYLSRQPAEDKKGLIGLIDINSSSAEIQIIHNQKVEFTRAVTFPPEDKRTRLVDEVKRTFLTYSGEFTPDNSKLILTGPESIVSEEAPLLKREFELPTAYINTLNIWPTEESCQLPSEEERKELSFTAVLALAFDFDRLDLNFLPANIQKAKAARLTKDTLLVTGLLTLCIILSAGGIIWKKIEDKTNLLRYLNTEIKKTEHKVKELTAMINNINIVKKELDMRGTSIDVIRELYRLIPSNISITIFDFEEGSSCTLRGAADELSNVFAFITILEESPYFENVKVRYATKRAVKKENVTDFEIYCQLQDTSRVKAE